MPKGKGKKYRIVKKGTPLPSHPKFKLDSSHLTEKKANKREDALLEQRNVKETIMVKVPKQHVIYVQRGKAPRITPKTPR